MNEVVEIINKKIYEHVMEVEATQISLDKARDKNANKEPAIETARNMMILKDKLMFHKACAMALADLLVDLKDKK